MHDKAHASACQAHEDKKLPAQNAVPEQRTPCYPCRFTTSTPHSPPITVEVGLAGCISPSHRASSTRRVHVRERAGRHRKPTNTSPRRKHLPSRSPAPQPLSLLLGGLHARAIHGRSAVTIVSPCLNAYLLTQCVVETFPGAACMGQAAKRGQHHHSHRR